MKWIRKKLHNFITWYLTEVGGAFHTNKYGKNGRYVVLMNEEEYHQYKKAN